MLLGIGFQCGAAFQVPLAPGRDDLDGRVEVIVGQLKAHLVVALTGGPMGNRVGALQLGDLHQALGDQRAREGGTQQVLALVDGAGTHRREDEILEELLAQVLDVGVDRPADPGLLGQTVEFLLLTQIRRERDDLAAVLLNQPRDNTGRIEPPRIRQDDLRNLLGCHHSPPYLAVIALS